MEHIGIILERKVMDRAIQGKPTYEKLDYYVEFGKKLGLQPIFFHPRDVQLSKGNIRGYILQGEKLHQRTVGIPRIMHNRLITRHKPTNVILERLGQQGLLYNGVTNRNKTHVHQQLWKNISLRPFLPEMAPYTADKLVTFLEKYPILYVKPAVGSVGTGVLRMEQTDWNKWQLVGLKMNKVVSRPNLRAALANWVKSERFLIQQGIPLARFRGQTFDIRVSVQKNEDHRWQVTGMVAKVANPDNKLSNLSRGGKAYSLSTVLASLFEPGEERLVRERLERAAIAIVEEFQKTYPTLADVGLDMGIDEKGNPYLIEVNVRDQRYSFYKAGELEMFKKTYWTPLAYGKSLLYG